MIHRLLGTASTVPWERRVTSPARQKKKINGASQRHGQPTALQLRFLEGYRSNTEHVRLSAATPLALALKTSPLGMFAPGLRKLGRRHTAAPKEPEWGILEEQLQAEMALGSSPSTIKTVLSAATWAVSMGIIANAVPRFFWNYVKGAGNAWDNRKVPWGLVEVLQIKAF